MDLKRLVEQSDTPAGRWFDNTVFALIVVSLVTFSIETLPNLSPDIAAILWWAELLTVALFTIEYLLRISVAERRWRFVRSFGSLIDLAAILPFYLSFGAIDLRSLRTFRLLRLLRILKLQRYSRVVRRMHRAGIIVREEMILFLSVALILIVLSAVGGSSGSRGSSGAYALPLFIKLINGILFGFEPVRDSSLFFAAMRHGPHLVGKQDVRQRLTRV